uniref:Uncharacterized protein n=1 Tax=Salix viminalis TaxID=40686 RepID=A0A6N2MDK2_SALVM
MPHLRLGPIRSNQAHNHFASLPNNACKVSEILGSTILAFLHRQTQNTPRERRRKRAKVVLQLNTALTLSSSPTYLSLTATLSLKRLLVMSVQSGAALWVHKR